MSLEDKDLLQGFYVLVGSSLKREGKVIPETLHFQ